MKFRVTDELTAAEEFSAASLAEFRIRSAAAASRLRENHPHINTIYLQVMSDTGYWTSPNYPNSNAPLPYRQFSGQSEAFGKSTTANAAATFADIEIKNLSRWLTET